jgi:hypothetical protein
MSFAAPALHPLRLTKRPPRRTYPENSRAYPTRKIAGPHCLG